MLPKQNIKQGRHLPQRRIFSVGVAFLLVLVVVSTFFALALRLKLIPALGFTSSSFSFTAVGDYGQTPHTTANLDAMIKSGARFNLALGDFDYDLTHVTADQYSTYLKSHLPANYPFEIVAGNHDISQIDTFAADLPDHIGNISGTYAKQYYFDYPPSAPLARFILISPAVLPGYNYSKGSAGYNWVLNAITSARKGNIQWLIVGMHENCFVIGTSFCKGRDLLDLLLNEKVDLILEGHQHDYQVSKQLLPNTTTCPTLSITSYNANCVANASTSLTQRRGPVIVVIGTGGETPLFTINPSDPKTGYFRKWMGANPEPTWGFSLFTVSVTQLSMQFVAVSGGTFTDSFTIHG